MANTGYNNTSLKHRNRGTILRLLATGKCTSRIDLARKTGLSKMAASNVVSEFISEGIIEEKETQKISGKGRNPIILQLSPGAPKVIGIHISRRSCGVSLCDMSMKPLEKESFCVSDGDQDKLFRKIFEITDGILEKYRKEKIIAISAGVVGPTDLERGYILDPPNFYGMHEINVLGTLKNRYDLPVIVEHEYDCAALAEHYFGAGRNMNQFAFVGISWGVGSGMIVDGKIYRSEQKFNSEVGHTSIDINGPVCSCGRRGCLETYISTLRLEKEFREKTGEDLSFKEFCLKYKDEGPEEFDKIFSEASEKFAVAITNVVNYTRNINFIMGHDGCFIPDRFVEYCKEIANDRMMFRGYRKLNLIKSELYDEDLSSASICGVLERIFMGELESLH